MSSHTVKVAVSLPKGRFKTLEEIRHKLSISRSALVDEALRFWLDSRRKEELAERYVQGYLRKPEDEEHLKALQKIQFEALPHEEWK